MTFRFYIGGYHSGHFEAVLKSDKLYFFISDYPMRIVHEEPTHIFSIVSDMEWQNLINYITELKWKRKYETNIFDGIQWELIVKNENKKLNCSGSNAFPLDFFSFIALLKKITLKHNIPDALLDNLNIY